MSRKHTHTHIQCVYCVESIEREQGSKRLQHFLCSVLSSPSSVDVNIQCVLEQKLAVANQHLTSYRVMSEHHVQSCVPF